MSSNTYISTFIEQQFPSVYREEGPFFVEFVKKYYEWMETDTTSPVYQTRQYVANHDIDTTVDSFIVYFKEKYLKNIQLNTATNTEQLVKNSIDLYRAKGTENAIDLFFDLIFSADAEVYYPGRDVFRLSDAEWYVPRYIEISSKEVNRLMVGRVIYGVDSGATAYVEKLVRKKIRNSYVDVFYLSAITGSFETGELLRISSASSYETGEWPKMVGSLTTLTVEPGSSEFSVGDEVDLLSRTGAGGKALVSEISTVSGVTNFTLVDGGWGYTTNANIFVSERVLKLSNVTIESTTNTTLYNQLDDIVQPLANVQWYDNTAPFVVGDIVYNYYANGDVIGSSRIISAEYGTSNTTNFFLLNTISGNTAIDNSSMTYYTSGNAASFDVQNAGFTDVTASANTVGKIEEVSIKCSGDFNDFDIGDLVYQSTGNNVVFAEAAVTKVTSQPNNSFIIEIDNMEGLFLTNQTLYKRNSNVNVSIISMGYEVGINNIDNTFVSLTGNKLIDTTAPGSNFSATLNLLYSGTGANAGFSNTLLNSETVSLNDNFLYDHIDESDSANWVNSASYGASLNNANGNTVIDDALNYETLTLGTIASLESINPGFGYDRAPTVEPIDRLVAPLDKRDYVIRFANTTGVFSVGELVTQDVNSADGLVKFANSSEVHIRRYNFDDRWAIGANSSYRIVGSSSGVVAYPSEITYDIEGVAGRNAIIDTLVFGSNSSVSALTVIDSGFGFRNGDSVTFTSLDGLRSGTAAAAVTTSGKAKGRYRTNSSFLSDNKYIYDGDYYQDFSYEIKSPITVSRYSEMLKSILHVAGTKFFSSISKSSVIDSTGSIAVSTVSQANSS